MIPIESVAQCSGLAMFRFGESEMIVVSDTKSMLQSVSVSGPQDFAKREMIVVDNRGSGTGLLG